MAKKKNFLTSAKIIVDSLGLPDDCISKINIGESNYEEIRRANFKKKVARGTGKQKFKRNVQNK